MTKQNESATMAMNKTKKEFKMKNIKELTQDFNRGLKDRVADIEKFGEQFVNHYRFKTADGVRYNVCTVDDMFNYFTNKK